MAFSFSLLLAFQRRCTRALRWRCEWRHVSVRSCKPLCHWIFMDMQPCTQPPSVFMLKSIARHRIQENAMHCHRSSILNRIKMHRCLNWFIRRWYWFEHATADVQLIQCGFLAHDSTFAHALINTSTCQSWDTNWSTHVWAPNFHKRTFVFFIPTLNTILLLQQTECRTKYLNMQL